MTEHVYNALVLEGRERLRLETRRTAPLLPGEVRIRMAAVGICGSDMHYYNTFGNVGHRLRHPIVLGHEAAGVVEAVGDGVAGLRRGDKVVVNPLLHCGRCQACVRGELSLCDNAGFPGSALTVPHIDGFFREFFDVPASCCIRAPADADLSVAALADPLACSLHALAKAGSATGKKVLVLGTGPVAATTVAASRLSGALEIVVGGRNPRALAICAGMGADAALNTADDGQLQQCMYYDIVVESTGVPALVAYGMRALRKGGVLVQLGSPQGEVSLPWALVMEKELRLVGAMRWNGEFDLAVAYIIGGRVDPSPILTASFPLTQGAEAFAAAADHRHNMKVQFTA